MLLKTKHLKAKDENPFSGTPLLDQTQTKQSTTDSLQSFLGPWGHDLIGRQAPAYSHIHSSQSPGEPRCFRNSDIPLEPPGESRILLPNGITKAGRQECSHSRPAL